eukprot:scaffold1996_cov132-Isochrysis_galbana.AAC.3
MGQIHTYHSTPRRWKLRRARFCDRDQIRKLWSQLRGKRRSAGESNEAESAAHRRRQQLICRAPDLGI